MRDLSASRTETNTVPVFGTRVPPPSWLLAKAMSNAGETHDLAGRFHLRAEYGVDFVAEAGEREHRLLDADMLCGARFEMLRRELEACQRFAGHDARRDFRNRNTNHLGDERHRARGARIDFEHVDVAVLDRVLHVHQAADLERKRKFAGLPVELCDHLAERLCGGSEQALSPE